MAAEASEPAETAPVAAAMMPVPALVGRIVDRPTLGAHDLGSDDPAAIDHGRDRVDGGRDRILGTSHHGEVGVALRARPGPGRLPGCPGGRRAGAIAWPGR